jgi:hypothetical protein
MKPQIITKKISKDELKNILSENFKDMVKVDVDIKRGILTIGGEWHSEGDEMLSKDGSQREDVWGANFYPFRESGNRIEYVSLINIKPSIEHNNMEIKDNNIKNKIQMIIEKLLLENNEKLNV